MNADPAPATPSRWERVAELFDAALNVDPHLRSAFITEQAAGDVEVEREVHSLVTALESAGGRFERPAIASFDDDGSFSDVTGASRVGQRIGAYEIIRDVAHGGMGAIYEAVRADDQYRKRVALKTIWRGGESDLIVRRFRQERQILAGLVHPNIAALLDGGMSDAGEPYFVMEFVDGQPIDQFCANSRLGVKARVALFRQVCAAVQYAHRNLVVHRDLKPNNVFVTADGVVKLLDFGIAKLLPTEGAGDSTLTKAGLHPRTTAYASPEQVRGERLTTTSDIYSLGVVLYELLAGRKPFGSGSAQTTHELERRICDEVPQRPSTAVTAEAAEQTDVRELPRLRRALAGDLDDIVLVALRKEPERRYATVEQLSEDLRRYLEQRPILARPDTFAYRATKFVRRNRTLVFTATAAMAALLVSTGSAIVQGRAAARERDRVQEAVAIAERERARAQGANQFLQNMLGAADPSWYSRGVRPGATTTLGALIESAAGKVEDELSSEPDVLADVLRTLGATNRSLGRFEEAKAQLERAWELHRTRSSETNAAAHDEQEIGMVLQATGDLAGAEARMRHALATLEALRDDTSDAYGKTVGNLGTTLVMLGRPGEGLEFLQRSLAHRIRYDSTSPAIAILQGNIGIIFSNQGKLDEAERYYRDALATWQRHSREYFERGFTLGNLGVDLIARDQAVEALPLMVEQLEMWTRLLGPEHPNTGIAHVNVARALHALGDQTGAAAAARRSEQVFRAALPADHPDHARTLGIQGLILIAQNRPAEAEARLRAAIAIRRRKLAPTHLGLADNEGWLGRLMFRKGRLVEADTLLSASFTKFRNAYGIDDNRTQTMLGFLVDLRNAQGRKAEAESLRLVLKSVPTGRSR